MTATHDNGLPFHDVMVDIESLSTHKWNALVLAVAAVPFRIDLHRPHFGESFMSTISVMDQLRIGREVSKDTQAWWAAPEQKNAWRGWENGADAMSVLGFCAAFSSFWKGHDFQRVWARGICFDINNIESLFAHTTLPCPWPHNAPMDQRSVLRSRETHPERGMPEKPSLLAYEPHHPIGDCVTQVWRMWCHGVETDDLT